jgi:CRISPR-associated protein Cas2
MYFISYDIANPKRLIKVAKKLENFGIRIQYSFFECEMEKNQLELLKQSLLEIIDIKHDSLRIYPLCENCLKTVSTVGEGEIFVPQSFQIL